MSTFGNYYKITTFGESHCKSVGVTINSPPPNFELNLEKIQKQLSRRRPGQSAITTPRDEADKLIVLSGMEKRQAFKKIISLKKFEKSWRASIIYSCKNKKIYIDKKVKI